MRRLWSHIALAATSLLMVGATFATVMTSNKRNSNIEFEKGREMVFRLNEKDDDKNIDLEKEVVDENAAKDVAKIMESRLKTADITRYSIETQGNDMIKVTFKQDTEREYEIVKNYLTFDATLALSNSKESVALNNVCLVYHLFRFCCCICYEFVCICLRISNYLNFVFFNLLSFCYYCWEAGSKSCY